MILLKNCNLWTMLEKNDVSGEIFNRWEKDY